MAKTGRPTKMTPEAQEAIVRALMNGNFRSTACKYAGVSYRAFKDWLAMGKRYPKGKFGRFRRAVLDAESKAEIRAVTLLMKAAENDPRHAAWWLAHRHNARWADKTRVRAEHTGKNGGPIQVTDARDKLAEKLAGLLAAREADEGDDSESTATPQ
jgi:hypothetical protein